MRNLTDQTRRTISAFVRFLGNPLDLTVLFPWTHAGLAKTNKISKRIFFNRTKKRTQFVGKEHTANNQRIEEDLGFSRFEFGDQNLLQAAAAHCKQHYPQDLILKKCSNSNKNNTLLSMPIDLTADSNDKVKALALSDHLIEPITNYLGSLPALLGSYVWLSPNDVDTSLVGSQFYHFDREDVKQVKCFIPLDDIDENSGPLNVVSALESHKFLKSWGNSGGQMSLKQRFTDNEVHTFVNRDQVVALTGSIGDVILVDTTNCLHFGSRRASKPKYHLTLHYVSAFSRKLYTHNLRSKLFSSATKNELVMEYYNS